MKSWVLFVLALWFLIGVIVQYRMFDYPVGVFWRIVVIVLWPLALFI